MQLPNSFPKLMPGDTVTLDHLAELHTFENLIAENIAPSLSALGEDLWAGREVTKDYLRPDEFNGSLTDIELVVMAKPLQRLRRGLSRGQEFSISGPKRESYTPEDRNSYMGFLFVASATSSRGGPVGQVRAELYYGAVGNPRIRSGHPNHQMRRYVTPLKYDTRAFRSLNSQSRATGARVLRKAVLHPLVLPIESKKS